MKLRRHFAPANAKHHQRKKGSGTCKSSSFKKEATAAYSQRFGKAQALIYHNNRKRKQTADAQLVPTFDTVDVAVQELQRAGFLPRARCKTCRSLSVSAPNLRPLTATAFFKNRWRTLVFPFLVTSFQNCCLLLFSDS